MDFTGYSGTFDGGNQDIALHGSLTFSATMTLDTNSDSFFSFFRDATITANGKVPTYITASQAGITLTLADDLPCASFNMDTAGAKFLSMGANEIQLGYSGTTGFDGFSLKDVTISYSAGAKFVFNTTDDGSNLSIDSGVSTLPPTEINADAGTSNGIGGTATVITFESLLTNGGTINVNTPVTTTGNMTLTNVDRNFNTVAVIVGGNFSIVGGNLTGTGSTFAVSGTCVASGTPGTISGCDFSGGTALTATGWTDGGGNTNVNF
jgi:hypothetical protein